MAPVPAKGSSWATGKGADGQRLRVWKRATLPASASTVRVVGSGYDETVGIYVGMCVVPKSGGLPTPCGGGVDKGGTSHASVWVSSNPPPYGIGLAVPYGIDGKFDVKISVGPRIGKFDCRKVRCAITTRADHTNTGFRGADVFVPLTFAKK